MERHAEPSAEAKAIRAGIRREEVDPTSTVTSQREGWERAAIGDHLVDGCTEQVGSVGGVPCRTIAPPTVGEVAGIIVYVHGGGLVMGSSVTHRRFVSRLVARAGMPAVVVDYRRLPEHRVGDAVADVLAVIQAQYPAPVVLAGDSSGAALALSAALGGAGEQPVLGLAAFSGAFDATLASPSIDTADDPQLSRRALEHWQAIIRVAADPGDPAMSPLQAEDLGTAPPMLLLTGSDEVWRDDSVRLADRLLAAGREVELHVAPGMWHCWPLWGEFPEAEAALDGAARFLATQAAGERADHR